MHTLHSFEGLPFCIKECGPHLHADTASASFVLVKKFLASVLCT